MLVCPDCFEESGLQRRIVEIRPKFDDGPCDHHPTKKGIPIEAVAKILTEVIENNYHHSGYDYQGEPTGELLADLIYDLASPDNHDVVEALQSALIEGESYWPPDGGEPFFSDEVGYTRFHEVYFGQESRKWEEFCDGIVGNRRFFNSSAKPLLAEIFDGLHTLRDESNEPAIRTLQPGVAKIFRARRANERNIQEKIENDPTSELGPPPKRHRLPGRMNPSGIRAFYGAFDLDTCLTELRPAVGETVMVAEFEVLRPILLLDTTNFERPPKAQNIFSKSYNRRMSLWGFMAEFMNEISRPCLPNDEHLDYIPTQAVSEYLVHEHKFKLKGVDKTVEGLIFRSAQHPNGKNIVLFGEAAVVETQAKEDHDRKFVSGKVGPGLKLNTKSLETRKIDAVKVQASKVYTGREEYDF